MVRFCCVVGCCNKWGKSSNLTFHRFPKDEELKAEWVQNVGRENWAPNASTAICSEHFTYGCFYNRCLPNSRTMLKKGAVPTIFKPPQPLKRVVKKKKSLKCHTKRPCALTAPNLSSSGFRIMTSSNKNCILIDHNYAFVGSSEKVKQDFSAIQE